MCPPPQQITSLTRGTERHVLCGTIDTSRATVMLGCVAVTGTSVVLTRAQLRQARSHRRTGSITVISRVLTTSTKKIVKLALYGEID